MSLLDYLRNRFGGKTYVAGFSFGATAGATAAGTSACDFALSTARQRGHRLLAAGRGVIRSPVFAGAARRPSRG